MEKEKGIWRTYDMTDGLPGGVHCLMQDRRGYLWLATTAGMSVATGLCRYDGAEFITYTTKDGLPHNHIHIIYEDQRGLIWLGTPEGVSCYDGKRFTNYTTENGLADNNIWAICEDYEKRLWFGGNDGGVSCYDGKQFTIYTTEDGLAHNNTSVICGDHQGRVWFGTKLNGASCFYEQRFTTYTKEDGLPLNEIADIHEDHRGFIWFGTPGGVSCYDGERFTKYTTKDGLAHNFVFRISEDREGTLWFAFQHNGGGASRLICPKGSDKSDWRFINYTTEDGLLDNKVYRIIQDQEGHIWFAHTHSGITSFDPKTIKIITKIPASQILIQSKDGSLWFSNSNELCCHWEDPHHAKQELRRTFNAPIFSLLEDSKGGIWVGTFEGGLYYFDSSDAVWGDEGTHFTIEEVSGEDAALSLMETRDGTIWVGTWGIDWSRGGQSKLYRFNSETYDSIPTTHPIIFRLFEDSQGRIWMGGWSGGGLSCYDGKELVNYTKANGLPDENVQSIVEDDDGNLWIGTMQGLCRFDGEKFIIYGKEPEFSRLHHQCSAKDAKGHLWFGILMGGLYRYDGKHFQQLTMADGLPSNCITGLILQPDGSMIIGTYHGIIQYYPTANVPPQVEIREVTADKVYQKQDELELSTTATNFLTISYHGVSLATQKMRYSYILEGYDKEWHETWERQVRYENLPVGEYTFNVIAINRDLFTSETPAVIKLKVVSDPRDVKNIILQSKLNHLHREVGTEYDFHEIIGKSDAIKEVQMRIERAIESSLNVAVLITGETGTGKELVANAIHDNSSRKDKPKVPYNCSYIPKDLGASTFFGHRKGAFTDAYEDRVGLFEAAEGGTLILDEIGDMPLDIQSVLLRVLGEHKFQRVGEEHISHDTDVRVIAMTNHDLEKEVETGQFRMDLFFRLKEFRIHIPPLRERLEDVPVLAEHFLQLYSKESRKDVDGFAPGLLEMLQSYQWPGNVRELRHDVRSAAEYAVYEGTRVIQPHHFPSQIIRDGIEMQDIISEHLGYSKSLDLFKRRLIEDALRESEGNISKAARLLGVQRPNLSELIKRLGIK